MLCCFGVAVCFIGVKRHFEMASQRSDRAIDWRPKKRRRPNRTLPQKGVQCHDGVSSRERVLAILRKAIDDEAVGSPSRNHLEQLAVLIISYATSPLRVFATGTNNEGGEFGLGRDCATKKIRDWTLCESMSRILSGGATIHRGLSRYLIVAKGGAELYSCGKNQNFQCGLGPDAPRKIKSFRRVALLEAVMDVEGGERVVIASNGNFSDHQLVVTNRQRILCWGQNRFSQLGPNSRRTFVPRECVETPQLLCGGVDHALQHIRITAVECGWAHTMFLSECGAVWALGSNEDGQCGADAEVEFVFAPRSVEFESQTRIGRLSAGKDMSNAVDVDGCVWSFGRNHVCSHFTSDERLFRPTRHPSPLNGGISVIDCGLEHMVALNTASGECWMVGNNRAGQLGAPLKSDLGDDVYLTPIKFQELSNGEFAAVQIVSASAGNLHTVLLGRKGELYAFGFNLFGQCQGTNSERIASPCMVSREALGSLLGHACNVEAIHAGVATTLITVSCDDVHELQSEC